MGYLTDLAASLATQIDLVPTYGEKDLLIRQLAEVRQAIGVSGGGGGVATSPADIAAGINQAVDIDALLASVSPLTALETTGNISLASIDAKLTALINRIQNPGSGYSNKAIGTRAANTTAYTANDVYGSLLTFGNVGAPGSVVTVKSLQAIFNMLAVPSATGMWLFLYSAPPTLVSDNAGFSIPLADRPLILNPQGFSFIPAAAVGGGSVVSSANISTEVKLANGSTTLYGYVVCRSAFTPAAPSETFSITLNTLSL